MNDALAAAADAGFITKAMFTCAMFEAEDYVFESNFPSVGDYMEYDILNGRFILVYYGTTLFTNKSYIVQGEFEDSVKSCGACAFAKAKNELI